MIFSYHVCTWLFADSQIWICTIWRSFFISSFIITRFTSWTKPYIGIYFPNFLFHVKNLLDTSWTSSSSFQPCELIISRLSQSRNFWRQRMIREWRRLPWGRFACSKGSGMSILSISSRWVLSACKHTYIHMKAMLNDIDSECTLSQWKCGKYKYFQQWFYDNKTWGTLSPYLRRYLFIKYIPLGQHFVPVLPSVDFSI